MKIWKTVPVSECVCVCVYVLWVCPLLVEKAVTEVALMYFPTLQPINTVDRPVSVYWTMDLL